MQNEYLIGEKKQEIRQRLSSLRDALDPESRMQKSIRIAERLMHLPLYRDAETVMFYLTHRSEVITEQMMKESWENGKNIVVPVINNSLKNIGAARLTRHHTDFVAGAYGIREPRPNTYTLLAPQEIDIVIVPGLAFDLAGNRIGYGRGCYDAWLGAFSRDRRFGISFDLQVVESLPVHENDMPVGVLVTETRTMLY